MFKRYRRKKIIGLLVEAATYALVTEAYKMMIKKREELQQSIDRKELPMLGTPQTNFQSNE